MKIYELLKRLPRDLRQEVISKLFSQQQRLFLEKWMVDMVKTREAHFPPQVKTLEEGASSTGSTGTVREQRVALDRSCDILVLASQPQKCKKQTKVKTAKRAKKSNGLGNIKKDRKSANTYLARICFDSLEIDSKYCDLQSALEYLVILTSIKQKMRESESTSVAQDFKDRLSEAISSSANDHGKDHADLKLSFSIAICAGAFSGTRGVFCVVPEFKIWQNWVNFTGSWIPSASIPGAGMAACFNVIVRSNSKMLGKAFKWPLPKPGKNYEDGLHTSFTAISIALLVTSWHLQEPLLLFFFFRGCILGGFQHVSMYFPVFFFQYCKS